MELPLLALPDAPHAADTAGQRKDGLSPEERQAMQRAWDGQRMACFDPNHLTMHPDYAAQPQQLANDFAAFLMDAGRTGACDCNNEPAIQMDKGEVAAVFTNELHYNRFMTQLVLCSVESMRAAASTSLTKLVRKKLMVMQTGIGFENARYALNSTQYYTTVAGAAGLTGVSVPLVVTGFTGMAMSLWGIPIMVAVLWGWGLSVSMDTLDNINESREKIDKDATTQMRTWVRELAKADRDGKKREEFYQIFKEHKKRVHEAMFNVPVFKGDAAFIEKIVIEFPGASKKAHEFRRDTEVDVHVAGGVFDPKELAHGTIIEESEEE